MMFVALYVPGLADQLIVYASLLLAGALEQSCFIIKACDRAFLMMLCTIPCALAHANSKQDKHKQYLFCY